MGLLLILPLLVSGFIVLHHHPLYYYKIHRQDGQYFYIQCARLGLYSITFGFIFCVALYHIFDSFLCEGLKSLNFFDWTANHLVLLNIVDSEKSVSTSILTWSAILAIFPTPHLWGFLTKRLYYMRRLGAKDAGEVKLMVMATIFKDSPLDDFLFKSAINQDFVMLHMNDRKAYVGVISTMGEPNETQGADQEIAIKPIMSGYRNKDTLTVTFTTQYKEAGADVVLIIRQDEIVSATKFDFEVYEKFQAAKVSRESNSLTKRIKNRLSIFSKS